MSQFVKNGEQKHKSRLVKATKELSQKLSSYKIEPSSKGVFGSKAKVICGGVTVSSDTLDIEFNVKFDDDMEANEAEIIIYNLTDDTINKIKYHSAISIEAGFNDDTGEIFNGFVDKVLTTFEGAEKITTIRCYDDITNKEIEEITYTAPIKASEILTDLLTKTNTPIGDKKLRYDHEYTDDQKVDGSLTAAIKRYSDVCGVSTFVKNGKIYCRHLKVGDDISFELSEETGLIGSPQPYEEEITAEDFKETITGYDVECLLQHRFSAGVIVNLKSLVANGRFRVRSGEHSFAIDECITKVKLMSDTATQSSGNSIKSNTGGSGKTLPNGLNADNVKVSATAFN